LNSGKPNYYYVKSIENLYQEIPVYSNPSNEVSATVVLSYTITTLTGSGGSISPSGIITVNYGESKTFTITPDTGYVIANVIVDASSKVPYLHIHSLISHQTIQYQLPLKRR